MSMKVSLLILVCLLFSSLQAKEKISFLTTDYCPLMCKEGHDKGVLVDIANAIYSNKYTVEIKYLPINRAFKSYSDGSYDGFLGGDQSQVGKNLFPTQVTAPHRIKFYQKKGSNWKYSGVESLKGKRIAAFANFKYANKEIDEYIETNADQNILLLSEENYIEKFVDLIEHGRIDLFIAGEFKAKYGLKKSNVSTVTQASKELGVFNNYISISPKSKNAKELLKELEEGFKLIVEDGTLAKIYRRYGVDFTPSK